MIWTLVGITPLIFICKGSEEAALLVWLAGIIILSLVTTIIVAIDEKMNKLPVFHFVPYEKDQQKRKDLDWGCPM